MSENSFYAIYGVRINDDADWLALEEDPGQCANDGKVGSFMAGRKDEDMYFLAVRWEELTVGQYRTFIPGVVDPRTEEWDKVLLATVDRLGLKDLDKPGWYFISDES